jgi:hypothetical protein
MKRRHLILSALVAFAVACGDATTGPSDEVVGTYTLRTVNGGSLPFTLVNSGSARIELLSSSVTLRQNSTFSAVLTVRQTVGTLVTTQSDSSNGTWARSGSTLTLNEGGTTSTATYQADGSIAITDGGYTMVYRK